MRKVILFICAGIISLHLHSQNIPESSVPSRAVETLKAIFQEIVAGATKVKWQKEGNYFKGNVTITNKPAFAVLDSAGRVQHLETPISETALAPQAMEYLRSQYDGAEILEVYKIMDSKGVKTYRVTVASKVMFTDQGENIKQPKVIRTAPR